MNRIRLSFLHVTLLFAVINCYSQSCAVESGLSATPFVNSANGNAVDANLSWDPVSIGQEYQVNYYATGVTSTSLTPTIAATAVMANLLANTTYYWRVRVKCNGEWSPWPTTYQSFVTPNGESCWVTDGFNATPFVNSVEGNRIDANLSWSSVNIGEEYQVNYYAIGVSSTSLTPTTTATAVMTNLLANTTYYWRVSVKCNGQWSPWPTAYQSFITPGNSPSDLIQLAVDTWAFRYKYDNRNRMTHKKVPGADWVYMVYDNRDRLVMVQDGEQRKPDSSPNEWTFTKYDALDRHVLTGIYKDTDKFDQAGMQGKVNDFYSAASAAGNPDEWFEVRSTTVHGYSNQSFPKVATEDDYFAVTYYDDYDFVSFWTAGYTYETDGLSKEVNGVTYTQPATGNENTRVIGQVTGTKVKVLDGDITSGYTWLKSVNYFDDKYRTIQTKSDNQKGGIDRTSSLYDFVGKVLRTKATHSATDHPNISIARRLDYDHAGRLLKTYHQINSQAEVLLFKQEYNELGQLVDKKLHNTDPPATDDAQRVFKQNVDYRYNIRGWLTSVNDINTMEQADLFGMNLNYNAPTSNGGTAQYNGNISEIQWKGADTKTNSYGFYYDAMSRIKEARYYNVSMSTQNGRFNEKIIGPDGSSGYDLNGNIKFLQRSGKTGENALGITTYGNMDNLTYFYRGNQLLKVDDSNVQTQGFINGTNTDDDYTYDANGNMRTDKNKGINGASTAVGNSFVTYNYLNLPEKVVKNTGKYLKYTYDATGRKLKQEVFDADNSVIKKTEYVGEFFYEDNILKFINHEEGRAVINGGPPEYQYHLKDHLGNVRMTFTTKKDDDESKATLETENQTIERAKFIRYDNARKVSSILFDHTHEAAGSSPSTVYNNNFSQNFIPFQSDGTITLSLDANRLKAAGASQWNSAAFFLSTIAGHQYKVTFDIDLASGGSVEAFAHDRSIAQNLTQLNVTANGTHYYQFTAQSSSTLVLFSNNVAGPRDFYLDYVTIEDLSPGGIYSQRLNGSTNEKYGLARSLSVMPGDKITADVYAKYVDPVSENRTEGLNSLLTQIAQQIASGATSSGLVLDGQWFGTSTTSFPFPTQAAQNTAGSTEPGPKAYLNWLVFDRDYNLILSKSGYMRLSHTSKETGQDVAHEKLFSPNIAVDQAGYVYIYLSNEEDSPLEVYFDDFKVEHVKSPVVQMDNYYPFGLTFNSYQRENSVQQRWKFQGQEHIDDLDLGWDSFKWRNYMPDIGRFFNIDPLADKYVYNSPYAFSENHVTTHVELEGLEKMHFQAALNEGDKHVGRVNFTVDMKENKVNVTSSSAINPFFLEWKNLINHDRMAVVDFEPEMSKNDDGSFDVHGDLSFFGATDLNLNIKIEDGQVVIQTNVDDIGINMGVTVMAADETVKEANHLDQVNVGEEKPVGQFSDRELNQTTTIPLQGNPSEKIVFDQEKMKKEKEKTPQN